MFLAPTPVAALAGHVTATAPTPIVGCAWWDLVCQGGHKIASSGLSAITKALASGISSLLGAIVKIIDSSTRVPLADPTYRHIYYGFAGLAVPLIALILFGALAVAAVRRDAATFGRAVTGIAVACLGGVLFITFAQLLVAVDNWLAHGIVRVTGHDITDGISLLTQGFDHIVGTTGQVTANMLLIVLMLIMLIAGVVLWFVMVLRQVGILVVVAFAPLLIAGWLWAPTRSWVKRVTETLVALVFTKSAIFALFGIGLALLFRNHGQTLADLVGAVVLLCGACFAPLVMLKLVHFAADSHLAGQMMGGLGQGARTAGHHARGVASKTMGRHDIARHHASTTEATRAGEQTANTGSHTGRPSPSGNGGASGGGPRAGGGSGGPGAGPPGPQAGPGGGAAPKPGSGSGGGGGAAGGAAAGAGAVVGGTAKVAKGSVDAAQRAGQAGAGRLDNLTTPPTSSNRTGEASTGQQPPRRTGPTGADPEDPGGHSDNSEET